MELESTRIAPPPPIFNATLRDVLTAVNILEGPMSTHIRIMYIITYTYRTTHYYVRFRNSQYVDVYGNTQTEKIRSKLQDIGNMNIRGDPTYFCNSSSYL